jgi:hypothetical protein
MSLNILPVVRPQAHRLAIGFGYFLRQCDKKSNSLLTGSLSGQSPEIVWENIVVLIANSFLNSKTEQTKVQKKYLSHYSLLLKSSTASSVKRYKFDSLLMLFIKVRFPTISAWPKKKSNFILARFQPFYRPL